MIHPTTTHIELTSQSDLFLLSTILGNITKAERLLHRYNTLYRLSKASLGEITEEGNLSNDEALRVLSAFQISHRVITEDLKPFKVSEPSEVAEYLQWHIGHLEREVFVVLYLSANNEVLHEEIMFQGMTGAVMVDARLILKKALQLPTAGVIIAHNHPSGSMNPSKSDKELTQRVQKACELFDFRLLDHLIVSENRYYSFSEEGIV